LECGWECGSECGYKDYLEAVRAVAATERYTMKTGMLWFGNPKKPTGERIAEAAAYYEKKYGRKPTLALVHPSMLDGSAPDGMNFESDGFAIRTYRPVLPGHIWIGIADESDA
jgi:hypothetical protein